MKTKKEDIVVWPAITDCLLGVIVMLAFTLIVFSAASKGVSIINGWQFVVALALLIGLIAFAIAVVYRRSVRIKGRLSKTRAAQIRID